MIEFLLATLLGGVLVGLPLAVALRVVVSEADKSRTTAQARAVAQQTYITELQNRLLSHSWTDFAQLQNDVATHTGQTVAALNSFGESRPDEAYGETARDLLAAAFADAGSDLEGEGFADRGPTIG